MDFQEIFPSDEAEGLASALHLLGIMLNSFHNPVLDLGEQGRKTSDHMLAELLNVSTATFCTLLENSSERTRFSSQVKGLSVTLVNMHME